MNKKILAVLIVLSSIAGSLIGLYIRFSRDVPSTDELLDVKPWVATILYDIEGNPIRTLAEHNRIVVPLERMPKYLRDAFIAIEDRKFYRHWGINIFSIFRAVLEDLMAGRVVRGASTITQQLARNLFPEELPLERSLSRKIKEAIVAIRIERYFTKNEILEMYLNQIYFGEGTYGVEAASLKFFGKHVDDLTLAEAALLAAIPKDPSRYSPRKNFDRVKKRQEIVLSAMVDMGMISAEEAEEAKVEAVEILPLKKDMVGDYFCEYVRQILERRHGARTLYREGLRVYTTLDLNLQLAAETAVESNLKAMEERLRYRTRYSPSEKPARTNMAKTDYIQAALIAIDPRTGYIKAMVGGRDFSESEWNRAVQAPRQPGSAFKVFTYTAAIDNGMTPATVIMDEPLLMKLPDGREWKPKNFTEDFEGPVTLRRALAKSINIPAIKLANQIGLETVIDYAHRMGVRSQLKPYLSLAIGSCEITLLEITSAFGTLAASGIRAEPMAILKVETSDGQVLEENNPIRHEVLKPQTAYVVTSMLQSVVDEGTAAMIRARGMTQPLAGKTGTTNDYTDAWFIGFCPDLVAG
ncbi:MAG: penicillin-binding protein 1A [bacterium]